MHGKSDPPRHSIADIETGDHLCCIYETEDEHRAVVTPYIRHGLERRHKVLYIVDAHTADSILSYLRDDGLDPGPHVESGQLQLLTQNEAYLRGGSFDPDAMLALLSDETERALAEGYAMLRVTGEMTWALGGAEGTERLIEYEAKLNRFFPGSMAAAICQYDRRRFEPAVLLDILRTHPIAAIGTELHDNFFYTPPDELLGNQRDAAELEHWIHGLQHRATAEARLQDSERRYRDVFDGAPVGIFRTTSTGDVLQVNRRMAEIVGYDTPEQAVDAYNNLGHQLYADPSRRREFIEHLEACGEVSGFEYEAVRRDGTPIWISMDARISHHMSDGSFVIDGFSRDVTHVKHAQGQAEHLQSLLSAIRNVNQLIVDATDVHRLMRNACETLLETRDYNACAIALQDEGSGRLSPAAEAGAMRFPKQWSVAPDGTGRAPKCVKRALTGGQLEIVESIADCGRCSYVVGAERGCSVAVAPLRAQGSVLGLLFVAIGGNSGIDDRERELLVEVADDLALACLKIRAEEQLRAERDRAQQYLDVAGIMFLALDVDGRITLINQKGCEILGCAEGEAVGCDWFDTFLPAQVRGGVREVFDGLMGGRQQTAEHFENAVVTRTGESRLIAWHNTVLRDENGRITGTLSSGTDVTEQRRAEEALRESEEKHRALYTSIRDAILVAGTDRTIIDCNPAFEELFGYTLDEIRGRETLCLYNDEDQFRRMGRELQAHGGSAHFVYTIDYRKKSGSVFPGETNVYTLKDANGSPTGFIGLIRDVTEQRRAEETLRESERKLDTLLGHLPGMAYRCPNESEWPMELVSRGAEKLLGYSPEQVMAGGEISYGEIIHPDDRTMVWEAVQKAVGEGRPFELEYRITTASGEEKWVWERGEAVGADAEGRAVLEGFISDVTRRRRMEEELSFHSLLLDQIRDRVTATDLDGRITYVNEAESRMLSVPKDELIGRHVSVYGEDPERGATQREIIEETRRSGEWRGTVVNYGAGGRESLLDVRTQLIRNERGEPVGMLGISTDITERNRMEQALAESERFYRLLMERNVAGIYQSTLDGRLLACNQVFADIFGYASAEEVLKGEALHLYVDPEDRRRFIDELERTGQFAAQEMTLRRRDGGTVDVLDSAVLVEDSGGEEAIIHGSLIDITDRKRMEKALAEREQRYRLLFERNVAGMYRSTVDGRILECNQRFADIFGYGSAEDAVNAGAWSLYADPSERERFLDELRGTGHVNAWEPTLRRADGEPVDVILSAVLLPDEGGAPPIIEGSLIDVTEHNRLQERLRQAQRLESVGQLAGGIAHDFNNILQAMVMQIDLGLETTEDERVRKRLQGLLTGAERAGTLTRQLLAFGRRQVLELDVVDLNRVIRHVLEMLRRVLPESIEISFFPGESVDAVRVDTGQMEQVLMNLAINARDAMPDGGTLTITTGMTELDTLSGRGHEWVQEGRHLVMTVADTGHGMDAATRERIFEPFFTTKKKGLGSGLGLATVHGIVAQHGGGVTVSSEPGRGTEFRVYLPADDGEPSGETEEVDAAQPVRGGDETVLIAEDEPAVLDVAAEILEQAGYTVLRARDGEEAVRTFRERAGEVALVLLDVVMPNKGGREACDEILDVRPDVPVLFSSGYSEEAVRAQLANESGAQLIQKPYRSVELLRAVREALDE